MLKCDTATNGKIALEKLKETTSLPDIIFLDLNMPIMNGFEFLIQIKKETTLCNIPIGIFSTSNIVRDIELTKKLGARFFICKPSDFNVLCANLQQILSTDFSGNKFKIFNVVV